LFPPKPVVGKKDAIIFGLGVAMITFGLVWGVLLGVDDIASILAGVLGMVAGVAMVMQNSKTMLYTSLSLSAASGVVYLFTSYELDYIGSILSFGALIGVYARRAVFQPAPRPQVPTQIPPAYPPQILIPSPPVETRSTPQPSADMYCPNCGNSISSSSRFCPYCGRDLQRWLYEAQRGEPPL